MKSTLNGIFFLAAIRNCQKTDSPSEQMQTLSLCAEIARRQHKAEQHRHQRKSGRWRTEG